MAQVFIERFARKLGKPITSVQAKSMEALANYPWPGNVRELESVLERAVILCAGPVLQFADELAIPAPPSSPGMRTLRFSGWRTYLAIQLLVLGFPGAAGVWLSCVQRQSPWGYRPRKGDWQPSRTAMEGSSFYKMPAVLCCFSGNIGFQQVHHLSPGLPNYLLKKCFDALPAPQARAPLTGCG